MTIPRSEIEIEEESSYHCISRCVRRAYLYGDDKYSGKNFDHRKIWIRKRLIFLVRIFTIEVLAAALMDNHIHKLLRKRPDLLAKLSDEEVLKRWQKLYPPRVKIPLEVTLKDKNRITELRSRLCSLSWFMKSFNEYIARMANKEDKCKGRFWEGRFKSVRIVGQAALLGCAVYIDLNPIRAQKTKTPEDSEYTTAYERIKAYKKGISEGSLWCAPISDTKSRKGFLNMTLKEYLEILDVTGRELKKGKRGKIPNKIAPILERIGLQTDKWLHTTEQIGKCYSRISSQYENMKAYAEIHDKKWVKGFSFSQEMFC